MSLTYLCSIMQHFMQHFTFCREKTTVGQNYAPQSPSQLLLHFFWGFLQHFVALQGDSVKILYIFPPRTHVNMVNYFRHGFFWGFLGFFLLFWGFFGVFYVAFLTLQGKNRPKIEFSPRMLVIVFSTFFFGVFFMQHYVAFLIRKISIFFVRHQFF